MRLQCVSWRPILPRIGILIPRALRTFTFDLSASGQCRGNSLTCRGRAIGIRTWIGYSSY
jgi:hypothetical protein